MDSFWAIALPILAFVVGFLLGRKAPGSEPLAPPAPPDAAALDAVRPILAADGKISAIRAYREKTGAGLRDAKFAVETIDPSS